MAITRVQTANAVSQSAAATTNTITISAPTAGNVVVVVVTSGNGSELKCTATNISFIKTMFGYNGTATMPVAVFFGYARASAGTTITLTNAPGTSQVYEGVAAEYSGARTLLFDSDDQSGATGSSTAPVTGTLANINNIALLIGGLATRGTFASEQTSLFSAATNSFAIVGQTSSHVNVSNTDRAVALLERIVSTGVSVTAGAAMTTNQWAGKGLILYEPAASGVAAYARSREVNCG